MMHSDTVTTTSTATATVDPTSIWGRELRATTLGLVTVITLVAFESTAVSTALPTAARALRGLAEFGWGYTGFLLANVVGLVLSGMLSDSRGPRLPLAAGLVVFTAGLLVAGTAVTMPLLILGRVIQGCGSGLLVTALYVVIGVAYPERLRGPVFAATSSAWVVPSLVGPLIAGALAQHVSWRAVFLGLVPLVVAGAVMLVPVLRTLHGGSGHARLADPRRLLRAVAVAVGIAVLEQAGQHPSWWLLAPALAGAAALLWGVRQLVPPGALRVRPGVGAPVALRGLLAAAFFGVEATIPLALSEQHGYGATVAGLPLAVTGISWAFGSWWQGRTSDEGRPQRRIVLIRTGFALICVAAALMGVAALPSVPGWTVFLFWLPAGLGAGLSMASVGVLVLKFTTDADRGSDTAALQLADVTSSALSTGLGGVLVAAAATGHISGTTAFMTQNLSMSAVAAVGVLLAGRARARA